MTALTMADKVSLDPRGIFWTVKMEDKTVQCRRYVRPFTNHR